MSKSACSDRLQGQPKQGRRLSTLLSRLGKVRDRGHGQYSACCPAHDDKNPSLSVKEYPDGGLTLNCFAGCEKIDIVHAIGLQLHDLSADNPHYHARPKSPYERRFNPRIALDAVASEIDLATVIISDVRQNRSISDQDWQRFLIAARRIRDAQEIANGRT